MVPNSLEKYVIVPMLLWLVVPIPVFVGSFILFRRLGGAPLLLVLIGSIGYLLWHGIDTFVDVLLPSFPTITIRRSFRQSGRLARHTGSFSLLCTSSKPSAFAFR
jgi:hypothetical protein